MMGISGSEAWGKIIKKYQTEIIKKYQTEITNNSAQIKEYN